ncbi:MAG TPA: MopE-related protein, partial [Segetibacter sp.]
KGAQEVCNGIDDDCDGLVDNDDPSVSGRTNWYLDADDDGYSTGPAVLSCSSPGKGYKNSGVIGYEDCNDHPSTGGRVNKGAQEVCNGIDDDCDGLVDNDDPSVSGRTNWYLDKDDDGYSTGPAVLSCSSPGKGYKNSGVIAYEDCNDDPSTGGRVNKGAQEVCNGIDDDCDGLVDNDDPSVSGRTNWYLDADDDGYSTGPAVLSCSSPGKGYKNSGVIAYEDCNDDPSTGGRINKGAQEVCNGIDDDCDGLVDNDDPSVSGRTNWYLDADDDGYSTGPAVLSCSSPGKGYKNSGVIAYEDCNDDPSTGGRINKGAQEVCNGIDDDCDGLVDNDDPSVTGRTNWYLDADDDGYSTGPAVLSCSSPGAGYKNSGVLAYEDCNDDPSTGGRVNKGAQEVCNGIDDDCDGLIDNDDPSVSGRTNWYLDADDDGYSTGPAVLSCSSPGAGYKNSGVIAYEDCDDNPSTGGRVNKGAQEELNGKDDNCNGIVDEETSATQVLSLSTYMKDLNATVQNIQAEASSKSIILKAFPNPTKSYFTLIMKSIVDEKVQVKVYDMAGREMFIANGSTNETYTFGEKFSKGSYVVRVVQAGKPATISLIKQ